MLLPWLRKNKLPAKPLPSVGRRSETGLRAGVEEGGLTGVLRRPPEAFWATLTASSAQLCHENRSAPSESWFHSCNCRNGTSEYSRKPVHTPDSEGRALPDRCMEPS